jgi:small subunit ribosomal protein S20
VANHKSALKRIRQSRKRQDRNTQVRSRMRTIVKNFRKAAAAGESDAGEKLRAAEREIRKAATKGIIPARRASRTISRLAKSLNASSS